MCKKLSHRESRIGSLFSQSVSNVVWQMVNQGPKLVIMTMRRRIRHIVGISSSYDIA